MPISKTLASTLILIGPATGGFAVAQELGGRHQWTLEAEAGYTGASSPLGAWTDGGYGKLRYDESDDGFMPGRFVASYRGQLTPTMMATAVIDYLDDASDGLDFTEAYLEWRPVPRSENRHRWKVGAFFPPLALENRDTAWSSPYSISFSAINTWLGEEIRSLGLEWSLRRRVGGAASAHELGVSAAAFYGNDPAGTLLFWRGWSIHDRQTRLNDRLEIPPMPVWNGVGEIIGLEDQYVEPFVDTDGSPGYYAVLEWEYARKLLLQFAYFDNRADPYSFSGGQWGWDTTFSQIGFQLALPARLGLIGQWLYGETYWLIGAAPDGVMPSFAYLAEDAFESYYLLLTRKLGTAHRVALRYDDFDIIREEDAPALHADSGNAWTLAYRYEHDARLELAVEWQEIESERDLWALFYGFPRRATESQLRVLLTYKLGLPAASR